MEPLHFGKRGRRCFGVYHPAEGRARGPVAGVVLCPAHGQEAIRAHRAFLQLAIRLAAAGIECLRFDYRATGDSDGDCVTASVAEWQEDIASAINELESGSGVKAVALVGLRLGATLACLHRGELAGVVAWSPIERGRDYLTELSVLHHDWLRGSFARARDEGEVEALGFPLTPSLRQELGAIDLGASSRLSAPRALVIDNRSRFGEIAARWATDGIEVEQVAIDDTPVWRKQPRDVNDEAVSHGLVPTRTVDKIVKWLAGSAS